MMRVVDTSRLPTIRCAHHAHRVSVAWLRERFAQRDVDLIYAVSTRMCADVDAKASTDVVTGQDACWLTYAVDPTCLKELVKHDPQPIPKNPSQGGGRQVRRTGLPPARLSAQLMTTMMLMMMER